MVSKCSGHWDSSVKRPISIALKSVLEAQNARPVCIILSGFSCSYIVSLDLDPGASLLLADFKH